MGGVIQVINKCPSCEKTAISPIKRTYKGVFNRKECGTELKISTKWARILSSLYFITVLAVFLLSRNLNILKHTFFSTKWFTYISLIILSIVYMFLHIVFVPLVKSSRTEK